MGPFRKACSILRYVGPRVVWLRVGVYLSKALGLTRRTFRPRPWEQIELAEIARAGTPCEPEAYAEYKRAAPPPFLFPLGGPPQIPTYIREAQHERQPSFQERLRLLDENRCVYFFRTPSPEAINWHRNPFDDAVSDPTLAWCDVPDYLPNQGDPRMLWEPSRAAWALDCARARPYGFDVDAGGLFWRWVDSWMAANPPFMGFQWKCGQEASVRLIAITMAFWSLADDPATTPQRWVQLARLAWATGYRVAHHINYAVSQKNNHAMSEACGLLLVSQLFPEFRDSPRWEAIGRRVMTRELRRQIYADGSYLQQSMNYERVMLHGGLFALRLGEVAGRPFPRDLYDRLGRCGQFLYQMMDPETGRLPNYGPNDGAYILPLSECDFTDFRPVVQAVHYLCERRRLLPPGPWDEDLAWLFGGEALNSDAGTVAPELAATASTAFETGGYYTLRRPDSWAMIRCHSYRDRVTQCDMLHLDLWWRGLNVLQDCGTHKYYVPDRPDVERYFKSIAAHNTVEMDGQDPLALVSRFLWLPWSKARRRCFEVEGDTERVFEGESYAYDRPPWHVLHRRTVIGLEGDAWAIVDDLLGQGEHAAVLRWHLLDAPYAADAKAATVRLDTSRGRFSIAVGSHPSPPVRFEVVRGRDEPGRVQGFASPYYGERLPIPTIEAAFRWCGVLRLVTTACPRHAAAAKLRHEADGRQRWELATGGKTWKLELASPARPTARTLLSCEA